MTTVEQYGLVGGPVYDNGIGQQGQTFASYNAEVSAQTAVSSAPRQRQGSGFACTCCRTLKKRCTGDQPCRECKDRNHPCVYPKTTIYPEPSTLPSAQRSVPTFAAANQVYAPSRSSSASASSYVGYSAVGATAPSTFTNNNFGSAYPTAYNPPPVAAANTFAPSVAIQGAYYQQNPYTLAPLQLNNLAQPSSTSNTTQQMSNARVWAPHIPSSAPKVPQTKVSQRSVAVFPQNPVITSQAHSLAVPIGGKNATSVNVYSLFRKDQAGKMRYSGAVCTSSVLQDLVARQEGTASESLLHEELPLSDRLGDLPDLADLPLPKEEDARSLLEAFFAQIWPLFPIMDRATFLRTYQPVADSDLAHANPISVCIVLVALTCASLLDKPDSPTSASSPFTRSDSPDIPLREEAAMKRRKLDCSYAERGDSAVVDGQMYYDQCRTVLARCSAVPGFEQAIVYGLLAFYQVAKGNPLQAWHLCGKAMRIALDLGLHRACSSLTPTEAEQRKSVFRSLYSLEVSLASDLGRPTSIPEEEIDNIPEETAASSIAGTANTIGVNTAYLHVIRAHRLAAQVLRGNSMHIRVEGSSKRRSLTAIQQRQLDAGTRLQQWYENMPQSLRKNEDQLSPTERMYKYIINGMYASLYMSIFSPSLPQEGKAPSQFQIFALSRVLPSARELLKLAVTHVDVVPPSHYSFAFSRQLLVAGNLFTLLHHKAASNAVLTEISLQDVRSCRDALQAIKDVWKAQQPELHHLLAKIETISGSEALRAVSEASPAANSIEAGPPAVASTSPTLPSSAKASPKKRTPKGSRRASPKKSGGLARKPPVKAKKAVPPPPTPTPPVVDPTNNDTDSSLTSLSSEMDALEEEAHSILSSGLVRAASMRGGSMAPYDVPQEENSIEETLNMVKEALASAPPAAEVEVYLDYPVDTSYSMIAESKDATTTAQEEHFTAPAPPSRPPSQAPTSNARRSSIYPISDQSLLADLRNRYYEPIQEPPLQASPPLFSTAVSARRQSIAPPSFGNGGNHALPSMATSYPPYYEGYPQGNYTYSPYSQPNVQAYDSHGQYYQQPTSVQYGVKSDIHAVWPGYTASVGYESRPSSVARSAAQLEPHYAYSEAGFGIGYYPDQGSGYTSASQAW